MNLQTNLIGASNVEPFKELLNMNEIEAFVLNHKLAFLFISKPNCSVCHSLLPQIKTVMKQYPQIKTACVNTDHVPEIAGRYNIFTVPVLILFYQGKEYLREARFVRIAPFNEKIKRIVDGVNN